MPSAVKATRAARRADFVPRAAAEDAEDAEVTADGVAAPEQTASAAEKSEAAGEESNFWKKLFLAEGQKEVTSSDYKKFQEELAAKKAANKEKAADKGCTIM